MLLSTKKQERRFITFSLVFSSLIIKDTIYICNQQENTWIGYSNIPILIIFYLYIIYSFYKKRQTQEIPTIESQQTLLV